jgi:citrate lyase subunit beta/citryl-CoA lyase
MVAKALASEADAVILDLEDSVPGPKKAEARDNVRRRLVTPASGALMCARITKPKAGLLDADLEAVVQPGLLAVVVPKTRDADDVLEVADALSYYEGRRGIERGTTLVWPLAETASAVLRADSIARASRRVAYFGGGTSPDGDLARDIGYHWSATGLETLWERSHVLFQARAAGVPHPMTGVVTDVSDHGAFTTFARQSRALGYDGLMVIHPKHVRETNTIFSVGDEARQWATEVVTAMAEAESRGTAATLQGGRMIDTAMLRTAQSVLKEADGGAGR